MQNRKLVSNLGIHLSAVSAIAFGLIGLAWKDFGSVWQPVPDDLPHRVLLACIFAAAELIAGIVILWPRTTRAGLLLLAALYCLPAELWLRRIIAYPQLFGTWSGFGEEFCLVVAAIMAFAILYPHDAPWVRPTLLVTRILFALCILAFGYEHFSALKETTAFVPAWIPPGQKFWAMATGTCFLLAGVAILIGIKAILAARLLTAMILGFGLLIWIPALFTAPSVHLNWAANAINLAIASAAWTVGDVLSDSRSRQIR